MKDSGIIVVDLQVFGLCYGFIMVQITEIGSPKAEYLQKVKLMISVLFLLHF